MSHLQLPFIIHLEEDSAWPTLQVLKNVDAFTQLCDNAPLRFRFINRRENDDVQWEDETPSLEITPKEFSDWTSRKLSSGDDSILKNTRPDDFALYAAYQYMHETFEKCPEIKEAIDWSGIGLTGRGPEHTTLWLGSAGAYTPGHYDTYGCNVVAQLAGTKRWVLFPPEETDNLYPTRQPFEESSVFSQCNLQQIKKFPKLKNTKPYVVELKRGDILYVPPKWWHWVYCLETSLAINTWIDIPKIDNISRVEEALVRWIISNQVENEVQNIRINYTERLPLTVADSEALLQAAIQQVDNEDADVTTIAAKLWKTSSKHNWLTKTLEPLENFEFLLTNHLEFNDDSDDDSSSTTSKSMDHNQILDAILSPDVIHLAAKKLLYK